VYVLKLILGVGAAVLIHLAGARFFPEFAMVVDVFLVVVALHALSGNSLAALLVGLLVGLLHDTLTNGPYGLFGFANTVVGYSTARLAQRLVIQRATGIFTVVSFALVLQQALVAGLAFLLLPDPALPDPLWVVVKALSCGAIGMLAYAVAGEWNRAAESRRRGRMNRLGWDRRS
jgi:rod shape-determining protein MreD